MLKTMQVKLNYTPDSWGVKIEGEEIRAFIIWKCTNSSTDLKIFGDDSDLYEDFVEDFSESMVFPCLNDAYDWIRIRTTDEAENG